MDLFSLSKPIIYFIIIFLIILFFMYILSPVRMWLISKKLDKIISLLKEIRDKK